MIPCSWCGDRGIVYDGRQWWRCACNPNRTPDPRSAWGTLRARAIVAEHHAERLRARAEEAEALLEQALTVGREMVEQTKRDGLRVIGPLVIECDAAMAKLDVARQYLSDIASGKQIDARAALAVISDPATKKEEP